MGAPFDVAAVRERFPALRRTMDGRPCVFADAPGGTQVPEAVARAMAAHLLERNANVGGTFPTSREAGADVEAGRTAAADLLGADPDEIVFGPNMTTLAFALSRSLARRLREGDEVVVTRLDHDANIAPWVAAAEDRGARVRWVDVREEDCTLDLGSLERALGERTRIVAFTMASNAVGTITAAAEVVRAARGTDAVVIADAVHLAQHRVLDVRALGADIAFCSPYKIFGPHLGVMYARRELLATWTPYKVRPAPGDPPESWETGTQNHEALVGLAAAVDYLAGIGRTSVGPGAGGRRAAVVAGMEAIAAYEATLSRRFLEGAAANADLRLYGIGDPDRTEERTPTFAVRLGERSPREVAEELARRGIFVWDGNYYALAIMERLGLQASGGAVRIGFCHYNTADEVDRVLQQLDRLGAGRRAAS
ncbi:MAG TPA: cysteine desulfurase-like protein [Actinomycetota bacterium]|nr:cysteine desulfurase-like protein [Actinomycetota bacterium]